MFRTSSNPVIYGGESLAPLTRGDVIQTDYVSYVDNYSANLSRVAVVGEPTEEQVRTYNVLLDVHRRTIETMLRPGVPAKDVFHFVGSKLAEAGYPTPRALIGHCAGIVWHQEEPIMNPVEPRPLKAGMVVCLEPRVFDYHIQDEILITNQEPQLLSDRFDTNRMFVIRA
jgi:Xaa-Pro aminopeptidase